MSSGERDVGRVPRRGTGRGSRGGGRARARAVGDLGMGARAAGPRKSNGHSLESPRSAAAAIIGIKPKPAKLKLNQW
ncbi:hypothetical protein NL676_008408 [Syzygium grande]|nr:hypothetical protein NL676_008408 [Syzygium grande]